MSFERTIILCFICTQVGDVHLVYPEGSGDDNGDDDDASGGI
jgi:hypothetical protein